MKTIEILEWMQSENLSRRELATRLGVNYNVLCSVLSGGRKMTRAMEQRIKFLMLSPIANELEINHLLERLDAATKLVQEGTSEIAECARLIRALKTGAGLVDDGRE